MQVVVVNDFAYYAGGSSTVALNSALGLARRGEQVYLFSAVLPADPLLEKAGVEVVCTGQHDILNDPNRPRAVCQGMWNRAAARRFAVLLDSLPPGDTVVHVHGWSKSLSSALVRIAADKGFKVVMTLHDYFAACPNGGFFNYRTQTACPLRPLSLPCWFSQCDSRGYLQKLWRLLRQVVQKNVGGIPGRVDGLIAVSDFSLQLLGTYLPSEARVYRLFNPVHVEKKPPVAVGENRLFAMVGRLSPEKGPELFARAVTRVGGEGMFVGEGPCGAGLRHDYPELEYAGWLSPKAAVQKLERARALVLPSLCFETQGMVVLEAAAMGIPAIVPDNCAACEFVIDGETGLYFRGGSVDDLAEKLSLFLRKESLAEELGGAAYRRYWANPCTLEKHISQLKELYREMHASG